MEDEIDLTRYIGTLLRRWYLVLGPALLFALVAGLTTLQQPVRYQARVLVKVSDPSAVLVSFSTPIRTSSEDSAKMAADRSQRLTDYVDVARSSAVAEVVLASLGTRVPEEERSVAALTGIVTVRSQADSDTVEITVTHEDADFAMRLADAWASEFVRQGSATHDDPVEQARGLVDPMLAEAWSRFASAQADLENAILEDRQAEITRRIDELTVVIDATSPMTQSGSIAYLLGELQQTERLIQSAEDMRNQLDSGGPGAVESNIAALCALKLQAFGGISQGAVTGQVSLDTASVSAAEMMDDLDSLLLVLQDRHQEQSDQLVAMTTSIRQSSVWDPVSEQGTSPVNGAAIIEELEKQTRELSVELEQQRDTLFQATSRRDLAWEAYSVVARKQTELTLAALPASLDGEMHVMSQAVVTVQPRGGLVRSVAIAGIAGVFLGALAAFAVEFWQNRQARRNAS